MGRVLRGIAVAALSMPGAACLLRDNPKFVDAQSSTGPEMMMTSTGSNTEAVTSMPDSMTTSGSDTGSSTDSSPAGSSSSGQLECSDIDDPNESEGEATDLGDVLADARTATLSGVVGSVDAADWYRYRLLEPSVPFNPSASTTGPQWVCLFVECVTGPTTLRQCGDLGEEQTSDDGRIGCCGFGQATTQYECFAPSVEVDVYMLVGSDGSPTCEPYTLAYRGAGLL